MVLQQAGPWEMAPEPFVCACAVCSWSPDSTPTWVELLSRAKLTFWAGQQPLVSGFSLPGSGCQRGPPEELLSKYLPGCVFTYMVCICLHIRRFVFVCVFV